MEQVFVMDGTNLFFAILLLPILLLCVRQFKGSSLLNRKLPPGPYPWPVLGNVLQMGKKPHISLARFAEIYGPLFSLKLGNQLVVIASSKAAATEILKNHDRFLSGRPVPDAFPQSSLELNRFSVGWARECDDRWKSLRTLCRQEVFSNKTLESHAWKRQNNVMNMIKFIRKMVGKGVKVKNLTFSVMFNMLTNTLVSKDLINFEHENVEGDLCSVLREILEIAASPNISDLYPMLRRFDLQGLRKKCAGLCAKAYDMWKDVINERRENKRSSESSDNEDFLDVLIKDGSRNDQINIILMEMLHAGTDTSSSTIEWTIAEIIKNPDSLKKVQEEIAREINQEEIIKESDLPKLAYLQACVKETLRLHPVAPFLLPHRAVETCDVMSYTIPKNSQIWVNMWAIGRDTKYWDDPFVFKPERFLQSQIDFRGNDFEYIPFGGGRRICPGLPLAARFIPLVVASLLHFFEWSLPNGKDPTKLDMAESYALTIMKEEPLVLVPKAKR